MRTPHEGCTTGKSAGTFALEDVANDLRAIRDFIKKLMEPDELLVQLCSEWGRPMP